MVPEGTSVVKARTAPEPDDPDKLDSPAELATYSWKYTAKRARGEFTRHQCTDLAAALTYYSVLAIFPALLALVSLLGVFGQGTSTTDALLDLLKQLGQGGAADTLRGPIEQMTQGSGAGLALVTGVLGALWSASGYVGAFGRAMNRIYQIDEGRPMWKLRATQLVITVGLVVLAGLVLTGLVVSGPIAESLGNVVGLGSQAVTIWNFAKLPVMLAMVIVMVAVLYYATPNVKQPRMRWLSVGALLAISTWIVASVLFGLYVANFGSYNKTYGSLAGVIVFLLWIWLTNVALLLGAEVDSELERARQLQSGIAAEEEMQLPPRDTVKSDKAAHKREKVVGEGREIREQAQAEEAAADDAVAGSAQARAATGSPGTKGPGRAAQPEGARAERQPGTPAEAPAPQDEAGGAPADGRFRRRRTTPEPAARAKGSAEKPAESLLQRLKRWNRESKPL